MTRLSPPFLGIPRDVPERLVVVAVVDSEAAAVGIGSSAAFTAAERLVQDLVTEGHGHDTRKHTRAIRTLYDSAGLTAWLCFETTGRMV